MSIRVDHAGLLDTLQDLGRTGYGSWGINTNGVMDRFAAQAANALVGNAVDAGVLEMHFPASRLLTEIDCLISITGADFRPCIDNVPVQLWKPLLVRKGSTLSFVGKRWGSRCYVAVFGGFAVTPWLGSVSTNLKTETGGWQGRALRRNDVLSLCSGMPLGLTTTTAAVTPLPWSVALGDVYSVANGVQFIAGREWSWLTEASQQAILTERWRVDFRSDRMGYSLQGPVLAFKERYELLSSGVSFGTVQGLPGGRLVILMADHQTTGGYPRVAHVVSAHLPLLGQLGAGDTIQFHKTTPEAAENMLLSLHNRIDRMVRSCVDKLQRYAQAHRS